MIDFPFSPGSCVPVTEGLVCLMPKLLVMPTTLRAIVVPCQEAWVAQALEVDVAAYGSTRETAVTSLAYVLHAHLKAKPGKGLFSPLVPAPPELEPPLGALPHVLRVELPQEHTLLALTVDPWDDSPTLNAMAGSLSRVEKVVDGKLRRYAFVEEKIDNLPALFVKSLCRGLGLNELTFIHDVN